MDRDELKKMLSDPAERAAYVDRLREETDAAAVEMAERQRRIDAGEFREWQLPPAEPPKRPRRLDTPIESADRVSDYRDRMIYHGRPARSGRGKDYDRR